MKHGKISYTIFAKGIVVMILFWILLDITVCCLQYKPDEHRLLDDLGLHNKSIYDNSVRPIFNSSDSVMVNIGFKLIQILDMEEKNQVLVTNAWIIHEWHDERIQWDPEKYNNLKILRIPAKMLWLPDIVLYNNADEFTSSFMSINAMVSSNGVIFWSPPTRLRSSCKVDITLFPFDSQRCILSFGSWTYDKLQVDLSALTDTVDVKTYVTNGEWMLKEYRIERHETVYPISSDIYPDIKIILVIQRRILYYILNIIFPCFWLNVLSVLTFCLPPDAGEKITLIITVLLSYSVFMLLVADSMPPTSEFVPLIGIYLTVSMATASVSVVVTVLVLKLHHCSPHQTRVPRWVRCIVLGAIAKLVRCNCAQGIKSLRELGKLRDKKSTAHNSQEISEVLSKLMQGSNGGSERDQFYSSTMDTESGSGMTDARDRCLLNDIKSNLHLSKDRLSDDPRQFDSDDRCVTKAAVTIERILNYVKRLVERNELEDQDNEITNEWKQVALIIDRLLFWIFLTSTLLSTVIILMVVPSFSYSVYGGI